MKNKKIENLEYETSGENVFADLGISNPEEALVKSDLALQINEIISKKKLTQRKAAKLLGVDQPKISALINGKLTGFSLERLFRFLNVLGQDVTITIKPVNRKKKAKLNVIFQKSADLEDNLITRREKKHCIPQWTGFLKALKNNQKTKDIQVYEKISKPS